MAMGQQKAIGLEHGLGFAAIEPDIDGFDAQFCAPGNHQIEGIGEEVLALGPNVLAHELVTALHEQTGVLDVVHPDHDQFVGRVRWLLDEARDEAVLIDLDHPKAARAIREVLK